MKNFFFSILLAALILVLSVSASPAATHLVGKISGSAIIIPDYNDGDTLSIVGAALESDDWDALRQLDEAAFHVVLNVETKSLPDYAFHSNSSLLSITGVGIESIGMDVFNYCTSLGNAAFPFAKSIGDRAFFNCAELASAVFPSAETIGGLSFAMCRKLERISFPAARTTGSHAFAYCSGLTDISFPSLTDIGPESFSSCTALKSVSFPAAENIGSSAFTACSALEGASFPAARDIGYGAFNDCASLGSLSFPSAVTIGDYAFVNSNNLTFLELGPTPPTAGLEMFDGSPPLLFVPNGAGPAYLNWGGGSAVAEGGISPGGTVLCAPGSSLQFVAVPGADIVGARWQKRADGGDWRDLPSASQVYDIASVKIGDGGEYSLVFTRGANVYRSAPVRLAVGKNPTLSPSNLLLKASVNRPLKIAFELGGTPLPAPTHNWMGPVPPGVAWSSAALSLTGTPSVEGKTDMWIYAENSFSRYSGQPLSSVYTLDVGNWAVESVSLNKENTSLLVGSAETLYATVFPREAANQAVHWRSDNNSVAAVLPGGRATRNSLGGTLLGLAPGEALITVTTLDGQKVDTCRVTVGATSVPVTGVELDRTALKMWVGESLRLKATIRPEGATNQNIEWESTNPAVATVERDGFVNALSPGEAEVVVTTEDGEMTDKCYVTVVSEHVPVRAVVLNKSSTGLLVGGSEVLYASVLPQNATDKSLVWHIGDANIATLSQLSPFARSDRVSLTGVGAGETLVTVTAVDGGETAECLVAVSATPIPVTGIRLDKSLIEMFSGDSDRLYATIFPDNATNQNISWSSDEPDVAAIADDGWINALSAGRTVISALTADGAFVAKCEVIVDDLPQLSLFPLSGTYHMCGVFSLRFRVEPKDGIGYFPAGRVVQVETHFNPGNAARQLTWRLDKESGRDILTVAGRFLRGTAAGTSIKEIVFEFDDGSLRQVFFSPPPYLGDLLSGDRDYSLRSGSGCETRGFTPFLPIGALFMTYIARLVSLSAGSKKIYVSQSLCREGRDDHYPLRVK